MWHHTREDLRRAYWSAFLSGHSHAANIDIEQPCPTFGTVLCAPHHWQIYEEGPDFAHTRVTGYQWTTDQWQRQELSSIDGTPLSKR
jgi:hypothetical protein